MPSGGDGLYYFSTYLQVDYGEYGLFNIRVNEERLCSALGDLSANGGTDYPQGMCSGLAQLTEGKLIEKILLYFQLGRNPQADTRSKLKLCTVTIDFVSLFTSFLLSI